jgi:hypothetical protein
MSAVRNSILVEAPVYNALRTVQLPTKDKGTAVSKGLGLLLVYCRCQ